MTMFEYCLLLCHVNKESIQLCFSARIEDALDASISVLDLFQVLISSIFCNPITEDSISQIFRSLLRVVALPAK